MKIARPADRGSFSDLWAEFICERYKKGGSIVPCPENMGLFLDLFDLYISGVLRGVVVIEPEVGTLMWGESRTPIKLRYKNWANGWGTYVRATSRGEGVSRKMRDMACDELRNLGIKLVLGEYDIGNDIGKTSGLGYGFEEIAVRGVLKL